MKLRYRNARIVKAWSPISHMLVAAFGGRGVCPEGWVTIVTKVVENRV